jgi:hypothetical protein
MPHFDIRLRGRVVRQPPAVALSALSLSNASFARTDAAGTLIGTLMGTTAGSTLALFPPDSHFALSGLNLLVGLTPSPSGSASVGVREALAGASNTPRDTAFTVTIADLPQPPMVGPSNTWNGVVGSGGTAPTDLTRMNAKPMAQFWAQDRQRIAGDLVIGVYADAGGTSGGTLFGVNHVDFWVEGTVKRIASPSIYNDTDANGLPRKRLGYWITLNHAAFLARNAANNEAQIFATVAANDPTIQSRVIGPITIYPEPTANDFSYTVNSANNDVSPSFTTLKKAFNAAQAAGANAPLITFTATGFYEMEDGTWTNRTTSKGFATLTTTPGVTATLRKSAFPTGLVTPAHNWDPRWSGIEYRGAGIVLDYKNIGGITSTGNRHFWLNGAKITNSIGTRDSLYWNKGIRPSGVGGQPGFGYIDDAVIEYVPQACCFLARVSNSNLHDLAGDVFTATPFVAGNYHNSMNQDFFATPINAFTVTYTGAGAGTIQRTGTNNDLGGAIFLAVNGATVDSFNLDYITTGSFFDIDQVVARINANAGFHAVRLDNTRRATSIEPFGVTALSSAPTTFTTRFDLHGDWWQGYVGAIPAKPRENVVLVHNIQLRYGLTGANQSLFLDEPSGNNDVLWANNWIDGGILPANVGPPLTPRTHVVAKHNTLGAIGIPNGGTEVHESYSVYENNVAFDGCFKNPSFFSPWGVRDDFFNNGYISGGHGVPSGTNYVGGFTITGNGTTSRAANLTNYATGDGRPKVGSALATTLKARIDAYDVRLNPRAATDAVGAFANGAPAPVYPF